MRRYIRLTLRTKTDMPHITYIESNGTRHETEAELGSTVMETAIMHGIPGIIAECGGSCTCATCHVYVDERWAARLPAPLPNELEMLECTASERGPTSRLSCQIKVSAELDGLVVRLPERQQ